MKLSKRTLEIIKYFDLINPTLVFRAGSRLATANGPAPTILAFANIEEYFPKDFAVFELKKFLASINLMDEPEFNFEEHIVKISSNNRTISYVYADIRQAQIKRGKTAYDPYSKFDTAGLKTVDIEFDLSYADYNSLKKAASVLKLPDVAIVGIDGKILVKGINRKTPTGDEYGIVVGETDKEFSYFIDNLNLRLIEDEKYTVSISGAGLSKFAGKDVTYYISLLDN